MIRAYVFAALVVAAAASGAAAQAQAPAVPRPATSPYLNLLRGGAPSYLNYYGLVRPEQQARAGLNSLQQQVTANKQATQNAFGALTQDGPVMTGTQASFMTHQSYFMNFNQSGGGSFQTVGGGGAGRAVLPRR